MPAASAGAGPEPPPTPPPPTTTTPTLPPSRACLQVRTVAVHAVSRGHAFGLNDCSEKHQKKNVCGRCCRFPHGHARITTLAGYAITARHCNRTALCVQLALHAGVDLVGAGRWVGMGWVEALPGRQPTVRAAFPAGPAWVAAPGYPVTRPAGLLTAPRPCGGACGREMPLCLCVCALVCLNGGGGGCSTPACPTVDQRWWTRRGEVCAWSPQQGGRRA